MKMTPEFELGVPLSTRLIKPRRYLEFLQLEAGAGRQQLAADRKDPFFSISNRLPSKFTNWLASRLTGIHLHDYGCTFKAFWREVIENVNLYEELHRYIPALASRMGVSVAEVKIKHHPRIHGVSKYGVTRLMRGMLDLITVKFLLSCSTRSLQLFGILGVAAGMIGVFIEVYLSTMRLVFWERIANRPLLLLVVLFVFSGVQLITMGWLGRNYREDLL